MGDSAFAVSRRLVEKGMDEVAADAVATKVDLVEVKSELKADVVRVEAKLNVCIALSLALLVVVGGAKV